MMKWLHVGFFHVIRHVTHYVVKPGSKRPVGFRLDYVMCDVFDDVKKNPLWSIHHHLFSLDSLSKRSFSKVHIWRFIVTSNHGISLSKNFNKIWCKFTWFVNTYIFTEFIWFPMYGRRHQLLFRRTKFIEFIIKKVYINYWLFFLFNLYRLLVFLFDWYRINYTWLLFAW